MNTGKPPPERVAVPPLPTAATPTTTLSPPFEYVTAQPEIVLFV